MAEGAEDDEQAELGEGDGLEVGVADVLEVDAEDGLDGRDGLDLGGDSHGIGQEDGLKFRVSGRDGRLTATPRCSAI